MILVIEALEFGVRFWAGRRIGFNKVIPMLAASETFSDLYPSLESLVESGSRRPQFKQHSRTGMLYSNGPLLSNDYRRIIYFSWS
jgi:hypothetical protein